MYLSAYKTNLADPDLAAAPTGYQWGTQGNSPVPVLVAAPKPSPLPGVLILGAGLAALWWFSHGQLLSMRMNPESAFARLESKLSHRPGVTSPGGLAAFIGRKKYGKRAFQRMAAEGRR